jgi:hypothetical protein
MSGFTGLTSWSPFKNTISDGTKNTISDGTENTISNGLKIKQHVRHDGSTLTFLLTVVVIVETLITHVCCCITLSWKSIKHCTANPTHCAPPRYNHGSNLMQLSPPGKKTTILQPPDPFLLQCCQVPKLVFRPIHQKSSVNILEKVRPIS